MAEESASIIMLVIIAIIVFIFLWLYIILPAKMATKRGRSAIGWVLLFWIITPVWGIIALLVMGDSKQKIREDLIKELHQNQ